MCSTLSFVPEFCSTELQSREKKKSIPQNSADFPSKLVQKIGENSAESMNCAPPEFLLFFFPGLSVLFNFIHSGLCSHTYTSLRICICFSFCVLLLHPSTYFFFFSITFPHTSSAFPVLVSPPCPPISVSLSVYLFPKLFFIKRWLEWQIPEA